MNGINSFRKKAAKNRPSSRSILKTGTVNTNIFTGGFIAFDGNFFDELRALSSAVVGQVDPENFRPTVTEQYNAGLVSHGFLNTLGELVKGVYKARHKLSPIFQGLSAPICTFPDGKAFRT